MSLDIYLTYKVPKVVNYNKTHTACGSTIALVPDDYEAEEIGWNANITHNMGEMASHIPVSYKDEKGDIYESTLYRVVWRPEELNICNSSIIGDALDLRADLHGDPPRRTAPVQPRKRLGELRRLPTLAYQV